jgi:hypothetical protein
MQTPDRGSLLLQLSALLDGRASIEAVQEWLRPVMLGDWELPEEDASLIMKIVHVLDDDTIGDDRKRILLQRLVSCLQTSLNNEKVLQLFSVLAAQDQLCDLVQKYRCAVLTRTTFVSYVSSSGISPDLSKWLLHEPPEALTYLCGALAGCDYEEVASLLRM